MSPALNEHVRAHVIEAVPRVRREIRRRGPLIFETTLAAVLCLAAIGSDYYIVHSAFWDFFGPVPGDERSGVSVTVMALSSLVAMSAYAIYAKRNPDALAVCIVDRCAGFVALAFVVGIGLMAARLIHLNTADAADGTGELFSVEVIAAGLSLLDRFFNVASSFFALSVGALTLAQLYVVDFTANKVRENLWEIERLRWLAADCESWIRTFEESPRRRDVLLVEREAALRQLEPAAAVAFASNLLVCVHEALAPISAWITRHELQPKGQAGGLTPPDRVSIDIAALKRRIATLLALDIKTILAAFRGEDEGKKRS